MSESLQATCGGRTFGVGRLPGRKRPCLYWVKNNGSVIHTFGSIRTDEDAEELKRFLEDVSERPA